MTSMNTNRLVLNDEDGNSTEYHKFNTDANDGASDRINGSANPSTTANTNGIASNLMNCKRYVTRYTDAPPGLPSCS